jgi:DhnA family fructose-bisphosphate aldolase class Ia
MSQASAPDPLKGPALILAADHRARGLITIERYTDYVAALRAALGHCDGVLASAQPLVDLAESGALTERHRTYLSINRTGLAGSVFELNDRLVATVGRAAAEGWTGIKHMTRIDLSEAHTADALELLGRVLEEARAAGLEALVESVPWRRGHMVSDTESVVMAAVNAHDMGAPVLKVPVPDAPAGEARQMAVARVVASVGTPVLFLGGPRRSQPGRDPDGADGSNDEDAATRRTVLAQVTDVMAGGGAGMALGRVLYQDPEPAILARRVADVVHGR